MTAALSLVWSSPVYIALFAALCYGFSSPTAKLGMVSAGVSPSGMLMAYGLCGVTTSLVWHSSGVSISYGSNYRGILLALLTGLLSSTAFLSMNRGFTLGSITLVLSIVTAAPLMSSSIEVFFMNSQLRWWQALLGMVLVVLGILLVSTSKVGVSN